MQILNSHLFLVILGHDKDSDIVSWRSDSEDSDEGTQTHFSGVMHPEGKTTATARVSEIAEKCTKQDEFAEELGINNEFVRSKVVDDRPIKPGLGLFVCLILKGNCSVNAPLSYC